MANFTWTPKIVIPSKPTYNILQTLTESFKRRYYEVDSNEEQLYTLKFGWIQKTTVTNNRDAIYAHYTGNKGEYSSFSWTGVPSYISNDAVTVRYVDYQETPDVDGNVWEVTIVFRKEN